MIKDNPELLLEVLEQSPDAFAYYGPDHRLYYCNGAFIDWFFPNWTQETLAGREIQEVVEICYACGRIASCNGFADWRAERLSSHHQPGRPYEYKLVNGRTVQGREQVLPMGGTLSVLSDITEHAKLAEARAVSEYRYRQFFESAAVGVYRSSREGSFLEVNPALARIAGCENPEEFLALFHAGRYFYADPGTRPQFLAKLDTDDVARDFETRILRKDGTAIWIAETSHTVRDERGGILGYEGFIADITDRKRAEIQRDLSESRFRDFAELSADWFWETDLEQRFTWQTGPTPILDGAVATQGDLIGATRWELLARIGANPSIADVVADYMLHGESFSNLTYRFPHPQHGETWVRFSGKPVYDASGRIAAYRGVGSNITTEKREEAARARVDAQLRHATQMAMMAHWVWDEDKGRCIDCSETMPHFNGLTREQYIGSSHEDIRHLIHPEDWPEYHRIVEAFDAGGERFEAVYRTRGVSGEYLWCREIGERIPGPDGRMSRSIGTLQDINEDRRLQNELRQAKELLQSQLDSSPLGIVTMDDQSRIVSWNPAAEAIFGWSAAEVIGKRSPQIPPERESERSELRERMARGEPIRNFETVRRHKDGRELQLSINAAPLTSESGAFSGAVYVVADISDRKRLEAELRNQEALALHAQKLEAVATLASGIAHDFNNMLLPIMIAAENLSDSLPADSPGKQDAEQILETAERVAELVRRLLDFSRAEEPKRRRIAMREAVDQGLPLVKAALPGSIELITSFAEDCGELEIDTGQLLQVLLNLVGNAADSQQHRGRIYVDLDPLYLDRDGAAKLGKLAPGRYARLMVRDEGCGISPENLPQIFDPFYTTKEVGKGTGLGLAVAHGIVTAHGGIIAVESTLNEGTTFKIYFPLLEENRMPQGDSESTAA
ncbi:MAG: PAS domain S-box protein [Rhodovibrionaceae bacterium]